MFKTLLDARAELTNLLPDGVLDLALAALVPTLLLTPVAQPDPGSLSRIGGTPVMAAEIAWPRPTPGVDLAALEPFGAEIVEHAKADLPLAFLGQIDLAALPADFADAGDLPDTGRLLFFYDFMVGPFESGTRFGRVIWDNSPAEAATGRAVPPALLAVEAQYTEDLRALLKAHDLPIGEDDLRGPFQAPLRGVRPEARLQLPGPYSLDFVAQARLVDWVRASADAADAYDAAVDAALDSVLDAAWPPIRLLGSPQPVQDDPRYDAVAITSFGMQQYTAEIWDANQPRIMRELADWRLLAEVDYAAWHRSRGEGVVYFLIRADDLAARRFDRVVTVYQQT